MDTQFLVLTPQKIKEFFSCENVLQIEHQQCDKFLDLLKASDIYLTDRGVGSSFLYAMSASIPSILLLNSYNSLNDVPDDLKQYILKDYHQQDNPGKRSFIFDGLYPYRVFPYGMVDLFNHLEKLFHIKGCYLPIEAIDLNNFSKIIDSLLFDKSLRQSLVDQCDGLRSRFMKLQSPASIIEEVLSSTL